MHKFVNLVESTLQNHDDEGYLYFDDSVELVGDILKNCKPFLRQKTTLYRGMKKEYDWGELKHGHRGLFGKFKVIKDRRPLNTAVSLHDFLNLYHKENGLPSRSESMFAAKDKNTAYSYGQPMVVFPVGKFSTMYYKDGHDITWNLANPSETLGDKIVDIDVERTGERAKWAGEYHFWLVVAEYYKKHKTIKKAFDAMKKFYKSDYINFVNPFRKAEGQVPTAESRAHNLKWWNKGWKGVEDEIYKIEGFVKNDIKSAKLEELVIDCDYYYFINADEYKNDVFKPLHKFIKPK